VERPLGRGALHAGGSTFRHARAALVAAYHVASNFVVVHFAGRVAEGETRKFTFESEP